MAWWPYTTHSKSNLALTLILDLTLIWTARRWKWDPTVFDTKGHVNCLMVGNSKEKLISPTLLTIHIFLEVLYYFRVKTLGVEKSPVLCNPPTYCCHVAKVFVRTKHLKQIKWKHFSTPRKICVKRGFITFLYLLEKTF